MKYLFLFALIAVSVLAAVAQANSQSSSSNQSLQNHHNRNRVIKPANHHHRSKPVNKQRSVAKSHRNAVSKKQSTAKKVKGVLVDRNGKRRRAVVKSKPRRKAVRAVRKISRRVNRKAKPSTRGRSASAIKRRRSSQRKRLAKQEEADIENADQEGFGEEQTNVEGSGTSDAGSTSGDAATPAEQPAVAAEEPAAVEPAAAQPTQSAPAAASPSVPANLPSNFNNISKLNNGKGSVGVGFASGSGPTVAFGYATSVNGQNSAGGFGASFSAPELLSNAQPDSSTQEETSSGDELAQFRRPRSILCTPQTNKQSTGQEISWIICNEDGSELRKQISNDNINNNNNNNFNNKSRILNKPPTLIQTHPLQSSAKQKQRKKYISNLRLLTNNNSNNNTNQSLRTTSVNNRTPNSWTFATISHNNNNSNLFSNNNNNSSSNNRRINNNNRSPNLFSRGSPLNRNFVLKNNSTNPLSSVVGSNVTATSLPNNNKFNNNNFGNKPKPLRTTNKQLSSTRRPFLSRSINYNSILNKNNNQTTSLDSDIAVNRKPTNRVVSTGSSRPAKTNTIIAISTTSNQHPFNNFNPVQFMQNIFDQFFGGPQATSKNNLFPWN